MSTTENPYHPSSVSKPNSERPDEFGDLLLQQKPWLLIKVLTPLAAVVFLAGSAAIPVTGLLQKQDAFVWRTIAGVFVVVAICLFVLTLHVWRAFFRVYERGVIRRDVFGMIVIPLGQIESVQWHETRTYLYGVFYISTQIVVAICPRAELGGRTIHLRFRRIYPENPDLDWLRDFLARGTAVKREW
jgi:hypothetical protein